MTSESSNPKLAGSNIVDAIPQTGECPVGCAECFYNGGRFYRPLDTPLMPTAEEAEGKIVRVNTGHDSNIRRKSVIAATECFRHKFFNTALPKFNFPGPVVFTCNSRKLKLVENPPKNLMFVRVRVSTANLAEADKAVQHYWVKFGIPVVMTFMRYYDEANVPNQTDYEFRKSILNIYWMAKVETVLGIMSRWSKTNPPVRGVRMCGTPYSSFCGDCRNCEFLYWDCLCKMEGSL